MDTQCSFTMELNTFYREKYREREHCRERYGFSFLVFLVLSVMQEEAMNRES